MPRANRARRRARHNKSLDASGGSVFLNLLGAAEGALNRAAASTQPLGGSHFWRGTDATSTPKYAGCLSDACVRATYCLSRQAVC